MICKGKTEHEGTRNVTEEEKRELVLGKTGTAEELQSLKM